MGVYRVGHDYRSSRARFDAGATVEVDDELAAWVNTDSPGTLTQPEPPVTAEDDGGDGAPPNRGRRGRA